MKNLTTLNSIADVHRYFSLEKPRHPLITVLRAGKEIHELEVENLRYVLGLYQIGLKINCPYVIVNYGRSRYDFQEGTMIFTAPNQVLEYRRSEETSDDSSWLLLFHPDLIRQSELGQKIDQYSFFDYAVNEALHLSHDEQQTVTSIVEKIEREYNGNIDAHSQTLMISNIELLLNYCTRFYDRQFYTRSHSNKDIVVKFEQLLKQYYQSDKPAELGVPTVQYCGQALNISPKYLSDLLRKETGQSAQDHIHDFIINKAKTTLLHSKANVSEVAYDLGFEYPQYFSKLFKQKTQLTPSAFRSLS